MKNQNEANSRRGALTAVTSQVQPRPAGQFDAVVLEFSEQLERLDRLVSTAAEHLKRVSRDPEPSSMNGSASPQIALVPLAEDFNIRVQRLRALNDALESVIGRVELL